MPETPEHTLFCSGRSEGGICISSAALIDAELVAQSAEILSLADAGNPSLVANDAGLETIGLEQGGPSFCAESPEVWNSLELVDQADFDAMRGCETVQGSLLIHVFDGADRRGLRDLREVTGELRVRSGGRGEAQALAGLTGLERVGSLSLIGLELQSLEGLSGLQSVGYMSTGKTSVTDGTFHIESARGLRSLAGLTALRRVRELSLVDNIALVDLTGANSLESISRLEVSGSRSLDGAAGLSTQVDTVVISGAASQDLSGFSGLRNVGVLVLSDYSELTTLQGLPTTLPLVNVSLNNCPELENLDGLQFFSQLETLGLADLRSFSSVQGLSPGARLRHIGFSDLPLLATFETIAVADSMSTLSLARTAIERVALSATSLGYLRLFDNSALVSLNGLESLRSSLNVHISHNGALTSLAGLQGITQLDSLELSDNSSLTNVDNLLAGLQRIDYLAVEHGAFSDLSFSNLVTAGTLRILANKSLESINLSALTTVEHLFLQDNPLLPEAQTATLPATFRVSFSPWEGPPVGACRWPEDSECDELSGLCREGTDIKDCEGATP